MKKRSFIILGLMIAAQFSVPFSMIRNKGKILHHGELFKFKTRPIDPADPFQGRYVRLGFQNDHILCNKEATKELVHRQSLYALVEIDSEGFAYFSGWSLSQPESGNYLKTRYQWKYTVANQDSTMRTFKGIKIQIPFDRYYMDEAKASRAEDSVRDSTRTTNCWANVRILNGKAVIEDVFAEGQSIRDLTVEKE